MAKKKKKVLVKKAPVQKSWLVFFFAWIVILIISAYFLAPGALAAAIAKLDRPAKPVNVLTTCTITRSGVADFGFIEKKEGKNFCKSSTDGMLFEI